MSTQEEEQALIELLNSLTKQEKITMAKDMGLPADMVWGKDWTLKTTIEIGKLLKPNETLLP